MEKTILTVTDLHYLSPSIHGFRSSFLAHMRKEDGKMTVLSEEIIRSMVRFVIDRKPDAFVITGDLSWNGDLVSHQEIAGYLQIVQDAGINVHVIGGNHDMGRDRASHYAPFCPTLPVCASEDEFAAIYARFMTRDDPSSQSYLAEWDGLRLLMLDVNSGPKKGILTGNTMHWISERLIESSGPVIAFSHQNFLSQHPLFEKRRICNADQLLSLFRKHGIRAGFSGHSHLQHIAETDGFSDVCTSCLSACEHHAGIIRITGNRLEYNTVSMPVSVPEEKRRFLKIRSAEDEKTYFVEAIHRMMGVHHDDAYLDEMIVSFFSGRMDRFVRRPDMDKQILSGTDHPLASLARSIMNERKNMNCLMTEI